MAQKLHIQTTPRRLTSLLDLIQKGNIQIPGFQRGFVWGRNNVKKLFDSIVRGYPIGTIFLWSPEDQSEHISESKIGAYTVPSNGSKEIYVLDGYQRLSTLFCCLQMKDRVSFKCDEKEMDRFFNLYYDADKDEFIYLAKKEEPKSWQFPIQILLVASDLIKYSRTHLEIEENVSQEDKDRFLDNADRVCSSLLDYSITCTEINGANISQAAEIFSRINAEGTKVSIDWMVHALSYDVKSGFNLAEETDKLLGVLQSYHFEDINRNIIFRCFQNSFGKPYFDQTKIEKLAQQSDFKDVIINEAIPSIKRAVKFLYEDLHVLSRKLLPYGIQLIFCTEFFRRVADPSQEQKEWLKKWFWTTTYESFFTIGSLADQREEYNRFVRYIKTGCDNPLKHHAVLTQEVPEFPESINVRGVRSCALALFVINNLFKECPSLMTNATYRQTFAETDRRNLDWNDGPGNTLFTDIEYQAYRNVQNRGLFGGEEEYQNSIKVLEASFFDINDIYKSLGLRRKKMEAAERSFVENLGFKGIILE